MKFSLLHTMSALVIFAAGFAAGLTFRGTEQGPTTSVTRPRPGENVPGPGTATGRPDADRLLLASGEEVSGDSRTKNEVERREELGGAEALADLQAALASGDREVVHEALDNLIRRGEPLSPGQIEALGVLLAAVDGELIELVAHALVRHGGVRGFETVMAFAADQELSLHDRRLALEAVAYAPPELSGEILPALGEFLEDGMPRELEETAAHALGRAMGEQAVDALLGLLRDRPGIRSDIVFEAIAATGRGEDTGNLLDLLSGDLDRRSRIELLRAIGEISGREGNTGLLLDLLRGAGDSLSRRIVSEAIADSSHRMEASTLRQALELAAGDGSAQGAIAEALVRNGGRAGIDVLIDAMNDPNIALDRRSLARALHDYDGPDGVPLMLDLLRESRDGEAIEALASGIARNGNAESMQELAALLEGGNVEQRMAIAHALRAAPRGSLSLERMLGALRVERQPEVSSELARSIGRLHGAQGLRQVVDLLGATPSVERREAILRGLEETWEQAPVEARELYVRLAGLDPAPQIRRQAIDILRDQDNPSLIPSLQALLAAETDPEVREQLEEAVRDLAPPR